MKWQKVDSYTPQNIVLWTKIDDENGVRNIQKLIKKGNNWWHEDGLMYVYYTPTHFSQIN